MYLGLQRGIECKHSRDLVDFNYFIFLLHRFFQGNYNNDEATFQQYTLQPAEITGKV